MADASRVESSLFGRKFLQRPTNNVIVHRKDTKEKGEIDGHAFSSNGSTQHIITEKRGSGLSVDIVRDSYLL